MWPSPWLEQAMTSAPKGVTREQVVRVAMEEFAARGYRGASLDMIATRIGVTRQALLHYFPSKVKLLLAVLELREQQDAERFIQLAESTAGRSPSCSSDHPRVHGASRTAPPLHRPGRRSRRP